jgi:Family of unknown function (DUF5985)
MASSFMSGMIAMGLFTAGLFFLRFWRRTGDGLFIAFGLAFCLLSLNYVLLEATGISREEQSWIYLIRLAAFALIIVAIVAKNMNGAGRQTGD